MDIGLIAYAALLIIGMWYAFRSGMLYERSRRSRSAES